MPSKMSLGSHHNSLGLGNPNNRSRGRASPTYRTKDRENMGNLMTTNPSHKKRRIIGI
jgi:hypothetical protein